MQLQVAQARPDLGTQECSPVHHAEHDDGVPQSFERLLNFLELVMGRPAFATKMRRECRAACPPAPPQLAEPLRRASLLRRVHQQVVPRGPLGQHPPGQPGRAHCHELLVCGRGNLGR